MTEGDAVPDIDIPAANIETALPKAKTAATLKLSDLRGKNVVLWFFPRAMTSGCTKEACAFRDRHEQFADLDTVIVGVSTDGLAKQQKFTEKEKLNFPLYADAEFKIAKAFGVLPPDKKSATRATFIINKKGIIVKAYPRVKKAGEHPEEVLKYVAEMKN